MLWLLALDPLQVPWPLLSAVLDKDTLPKIDLSLPTNLMKKTGEITVHVPVQKAWLKKVTLSYGETRQTVMRDFRWIIRAGDKRAGCILPFTEVTPAVDMEMRRKYTLDADDTLLCSTHYLEVNRLRVHWPPLQDLQGQSS